jgi:hypothetical protein
MVKMKIASPIITMLKNTNPIETCRAGDFSSIPSLTKSRLNYNNDGKGDNYNIREN